MKALLPIGIVVFLCVMSFGSLYLSDVSLNQAKRLSAGEKQYRVLAEKRDSLRAEVFLLSGFARMESVWTASGRPCADVGQVEEATAASVMASHDVKSEPTDGSGGSRASVQVAEVGAQVKGQ